jgi:hypothetical protein
MINIGSYIYSNIGDLVDTHCYPLVAEQSTNYPFIIYRTTTTNDTSKDGIYEWQHTVDITVCDEEYDSCCSIVENVVNRLYAMEDTDEIIEVAIDSITEDFIENAYVKIISARLYSLHK